MAPWPGDLGPSERLPLPAVPRVQEGLPQVLPRFFVARRSRAAFGSPLEICVFAAAAAALSRRPGFRRAGKAVQLRSPGPACAAASHRRAPLHQPGPPPEWRRRRQQVPRICPTAALALCLEAETSDGRPPTLRSPSLGAEQRGPLWPDLRQPGRSSPPPHHFFGVTLFLGKGGNKVVSRSEP